MPSTVFDSLCNDAFAWVCSPKMLQKAFPLVRGGLQRELSSTFFLMTNWPECYCPEIAILVYGNNYIIIPIYETKKPGSYSIKFWQKIIIFIIKPV